MKAKSETPVYLPDQRGVYISAFGGGNNKLGPGVFTYSRLTRREGTCPGATDECEAICYAQRVLGVVRMTWQSNSDTDGVPEIPAECKVIRMHVGGDFDTVRYIKNWIERLTERPDVTAWAYTRSWRVPALLEGLEELRALPNMQLFASMDPSNSEMPPAGWRRAWIWRDKPSQQWPMEQRLVWYHKVDMTRFTDTSPNVRLMPASQRGSLRTADCTVDGVKGLVCPEQTGDKPDCLSCGYCFEGQSRDVIFLEH